MQPEVVVGTFSLTQILSIAGTTAAPILVAGVAAFTAVRTKVDLFAKHNKEAHDDIKQRLDKQNGKLSSVNERVHEVELTCARTHGLEPDGGSG